MKTPILASAFICLTALIASAQTTSGKATASGTCSIANTGKVDKLTINCGVGAEQGKQLIEIMNKILSNQEKLDLDGISAKLDEIYKAINPNIPQRTYTCLGNYTDIGPGAGAGIAMNLGGNADEYNRLATLGESRQIEQLLKQSKIDLQQYQGWLSPYLFLSFAYLGKHDLVNARKMLDTYSHLKGPRYDQVECNELENDLQQRLSSLERRKK